MQERAPSYPLEAETEKKMPQSAQAQRGQITNGKE
jgi:hypothetical protein